MEAPSQTHRGRFPQALRLAGRRARSQPGARTRASPPSPGPTARASPLVRCRRRGLGAAPGEGGGSLAGGGSQDEASDSAPSRSGLQCSSYRRRDGSVSCFLGMSGGSGSQETAPHGTTSCPSSPPLHGGPLHSSPFLPPSIPGVSEALGKRVVVDLQLRDLRGPRGSGDVRMWFYNLAWGIPRSAAASPPIRETWE